MTTIKAASYDLKKTPAQALLLAKYSDKRALSKTALDLDKAYEKIISKTYSNASFTGEPETAISAQTTEKPSKRIVTLGLGPQTDITLESLSNTLANALKQLQAQGIKDIAIVTDSFFTTRFDNDLLLEKLIIAAKLGLYQFNGYKTLNKKAIKTVETVTFLGDKHKSWTKIIDEAQIIADAVNDTRDLINTPPNVANPEYVAKYAASTAKKLKLKCTVLNETEIKKQKLNCIQAVAKGSANKPQLVIIEYNGTSKSKKPIALVGKGVTFDSGGLNVKTHPHIQNMKYDKSGACAVLSTIFAAAKLKLKVNIVALTPLVENMPSANAYRPDDVITSYSGITVEVKNTDAEGRMILADSLAYAQKYKPQAIIDVATLTGASKIVLGPYGICFMGTDTHLISRIKNASVKSLERVWELPLWDEYNTELKSDVADVKHIGDNGIAGTIIAGAFLRNFVGDTPWAHFDIASTSRTKGEKAVNPKGPTGVSVQLFLELLKNWQ